jgi:chemotaxis protein methyltransferase CheR
VTEKLPEAMLRALSEVLEGRMGLHFPEHRWRDLEKGFVAATQELGCASPRECLDRLLSADLSKPQIEILASRLTIGETYFFRDRKVFAALEEQVLPELIHQRSGQRRLRLWSAGCATGEEPYSLAILLRRLLPDLKAWNITILASDINPRFLAKAQEGLYGAWSFRECPSWLIDRYFDPAPEGRHRLKEQIKKMVHFSYLNLAEDAYPAIANNTAGMDLILCRNVLMYFSEASRRQVAAAMFRSLVAGGFLFVSPSELSHTIFAEYTAVHYQGTTFYRKEREPAAGWPAEPVRAPEHAPAAIPHPPSGGPLPAQVAPAPAPPAPPPGGPRAPGSPMEEADLLYAQGRYAAAAEKIEALLRSQETADHAAMALLARAYANLGLIEQALNWARRAAASDKLNPRLHYLVGILAEEHGKVEEAAAALRRAVYLDPRFVLAHYSLGNLARQLNRPAQAARHFANARTVLASWQPEEIIPESEGMTAGRLQEIITIMTDKESSS